jgi:hypothetical protein
MCKIELWQEFRQYNQRVEDLRLIPFVYYLADKIGLECRSRSYK